ncbi:MAG: ABC-2 transporter permease [Limnochordales bacterium]
MLKLVYKDFLVHRTLLAVYAALALFLTVQFGGAEAPLAGATMVGMFLPFAAANQDDRFNAHVLLNSLPVTRRELVTAKYVFHLAAGVGLMLVAAVGRAALGGVPVPRALELLTNVVVLAVFLSTFFPLYYWLGQRFVYAGMLTLLLIVLAVEPIVYNLAVRNNFWGLLEWLRTLPEWWLYAWPAAAGVLLLAASWRVSVAIYERKEF